MVAPPSRDSTDYGVMEFNTDETSLGCLNLSVMKAFLVASIYLVLGVLLKMIMVNSSLFCESVGLSNMIEHKLWLLKRRTCLTMQVVSFLVRQIF